MVYSPKENMELNIWYVSVLVKREQIKTQYAQSVWFIHSWQVRLSDQQHEEQTNGWLSLGQISENLCNDD